MKFIAIALTMILMACSLEIKTTESPDSTIHTLPSGTTWQVIDKTKQVELPDTTSAYVCKYNKGWKCNKLRAATNVDF